MHGGVNSTFNCRFVDPCASPLELARDVLNEPDKYESAIQKTSISIAGHVGGGAQVREVGER